MKKVNVSMSLPAVIIRGIQDGPDLTKWGIIVALALTFVSIVSAGIETSPDGADPIGVKGAATCVGDTYCTCTWFCGQSGGVQHEPREPWTCPTMQENDQASN